MYHVFTGSESACEKNAQNVYRHFTKHNSATEVIITVVVIVVIVIVVVVIVHNNLDAW